MLTTRRVLVAGAVVVAAALIAGYLLVFRAGADDQRHLTVDFDRTVSLYEGADVRILGVPVGEVDSVEPRGDKVRVELSWDAEHKVPADAKAVIVSPAIVGDRYVQLTPAYESGAELEDDAVLDASDTAVPVELDRVYESLDQLATALGPEGANKNGSLDRLLSGSAKAFDGQGKKFNRMLRDLSKLTGTLDDNKDELFGSAEQLERFVKALADNDSAVREFNASLSEVSSMLSGERNDLAGALKALGGSLEEVRSYVRQNRSALKGNVDALVDVTNQLVGQRKNLAKIMNTAPTALSNQLLAYNPSIGALDSRSTIFTDASLRTEGFDGGLVSPRNPNPIAWFGTQYATCALLAKNGQFSLPNQPGGAEKDACEQAFPANAFGYLLQRGLPGSGGGKQSLGVLERRDRSDGLAALLSAGAP